MRWFRGSRRRRKEQSTSGQLGDYTPGSWAQAAEPGPFSVVMPPPEATVTVVPAPVASPQQVVQAPPVFVQPSFPPADVPESPVVPQPAGVRLGFADGTAVELDPSDPRAKKLKAVAAFLTHRGPHP